jgi:hypothetical protein
MRTRHAVVTGTHILGHLYLPDEISMFGSHKVPKIEVAMPPERIYLDYIKARLITPCRHTSSRAPNIAARRT